MRETSSGKAMCNAADTCSTIREGKASAAGAGRGAIGRSERGGVMTCERCAHVATCTSREQIQSPTFSFKIHNIAKNEKTRVQLNTSTKQNSQASRTSLALLDDVVVTDVVVTGRGDADKGVVTPVSVVACAVPCVTSIGPTWVWKCSGNVIRASTCRWQESEENKRQKTGKKISGALNTLLQLKTLVAPQLVRSMCKLPKKASVPVMRKRQTTSPDSILVQLVPAP